jgi:hypothetical protein
MNLKAAVEPPRRPISDSAKIPTRMNLVRIDIILVYTALPSCRYWRDITMAHYYLADMVYAVV